MRFRASAQSFRPAAATPDWYAFTAASGGRIDCGAAGPVGARSNTARAGSQPAARGVGTATGHSLGRIQKGF